MKAKSVVYTKVKEGKQLSDMRSWIENSLQKEKLDPMIILSPKSQKSLQNSSSAKKRKSKSAKKRTKGG